MITIIGAGPAGCYLGSLLAETDKVTIIEEHKEIGQPVQCTGLLTSKINNYIKLPENIIENKIQKVRVSSNNNNLDLKLKNPNIVVNRKKFDQFLAKKAEDNGAKILTNSKFVNYKNKKVFLKDKSQIKTDYLIGADGPLSKVSKLINKTTNKYMIGIQARVNLNNDNTLEFYPNIGEFAWCVPENNKIMRVGIASYQKPNDILRSFLQFKDIKESDIIEYQGGLIPLYNAKQKINQDNIYLIGDAASQVKATTGGGIIPAFQAAKALEKAINNNSNYKKENKKLNMQIKVHLKLRKIMDRFSEKDWNRLIQIFNKKNNKEILENIDRDEIIKIILSLTKETRLYPFARYLF